MTPERNTMVVRMNRRKAGTRTVAPAALALGMTLAVALDGCSVVQKADVFDWFGSDDKPVDQANKPLTADEPYPNLADVPGRPARPPAIDRDKIAQGLVADRENAQYTEDVLRRAPETGLPQPAVAARPTASAALAPAAAVPSAPPAQVASPPPAQVASAPLAPPASPPPAEIPSAPLAPVAAAPPPAAYVPPADTPLDPNAPPMTMVNNKPVVSAGFYGTEPPPTPAPTPAPAASAAFDARQRTIPLPPPAAPSAQLADVKPSPVAVARSDNVAIRSTEPLAEPPPAAPIDVAPLPNAGAPSTAPVPYPAAASFAPLASAGAPAPTLPINPSPVRPSPVAPLAALPPVAPSVTPPSTPPDQLDQALRQTFPDAASSQGIDALAATIYFGEGAVGLTEDDRAILREVARLHRERGGTVRVVGYASPEASGGDVMARRLANLEVSARRADTVSRELSRSGVPAGVITSSAGSTPAAPGTAGGGFGAAGARRVDIYLDY